MVDVDPSWYSHDAGVLDPIWNLMLVRESKYISFSFRGISDSVFYFGMRNIMYLIHNIIIFVIAIYTVTM